MQSLPTFIDLDPSSSRRPQSQSEASSGYGTGDSSREVDDAVFETAAASADAAAPRSQKSDVDEMDLFPLKISSSSSYSGPSETRRTAFASPASTARSSVKSSSSTRSSARSSSTRSSIQSASVDMIEEEEEEDYDDDFAIHVVDSAQQHTQQPQQESQRMQQQPQRPMASAEPTPMISDALVDAATSSGRKSSSSGRIASTSGAIPKLFMVPTPPTVSKTPSFSSSASSAASRRARLTARLSADGKLQGAGSSRLSPTALPPLNPLKKSF